MSKTIKLGFIGCGGHSGRHADVLKQIPHDFTIVGAMDTDQKVAVKFLVDHNAAGLATSDLSDFMAVAGMDAVLIGTPHKYHLELCKTVLAGGKHVLCEKPLWEGAHQDEGRRVINNAAQRGLIFSSCHLRRYEEEYIHVKDHLPEYIRDFGPPVEARFQFFYHEPSTGWKMNDSLLLDHMNHEIDLVHFLFGHSKTQFWRLSHSHDEYRAAGKTENGLGIWFSGYRRLKTRTFRNELELIFERGRVRTEIVLDSVTGIVNSTISAQSFEDDKLVVTNFRAHSYDNALVGVMKNFAAAIRGEEPCYLRAEDLIVNTTLCNDLVTSEHASF